MTHHDTPRPQDKSTILRRLSLFAACTDDQFQLVLERSRLVEYKKGETIYQEGNLAEAFYVVASGRLQVFTIGDGKKHVYTVLHNGDSFGEISLLTGETHSATVEAINDTLVLQLEKQDFDELINRIPSFALHLSRLLSKRLRTKGQGTESGDATVVATYRASPGGGQSLFLVALAAMLHRETHHQVVVVDFSTSEGHAHQWVGIPHPLLKSPPASPELWSEEILDRELLRHPAGFDFFYAGGLVDEEGQSLVAQVISGLAQRYRYILLDLPDTVDAFVVKALTQADLAYFITDTVKENVLRTRALMQQLIEAAAIKDDQVKIILTRVPEGEESLSPSEAVEMLGRPVSFTLPSLTSPTGPLTIDALTQLLERQDSPYAVIVRRIARELGGLLVGLALGSGAALGLAHIGVLKVLEREKIPIDIVAGSSIGAMIAGLWASGRSAAELEQMALRFKNPWDIRRLFVLDLSLPILSLVIGMMAGVVVGLLTGFWAGLLFGFMATVVLGLITGPLVGGPIQGTQLMARLESDFRGKTFEDTWLPLKVVATNPALREEVVFESGSLAQAVRASVSIPGIFKPVTYQGKMCLDGGIVNPVPVEVLKRAGAKRVIAVNVFPTNEQLKVHLARVEQQRTEWDAQLASRSFPVRMMVRLRQELSRSASPLIFDVIMRAMQAMEYQIAEISCRNADLLLRPSVPGSHWLEFFHPEPFIQRGEEEALKQLPLLKRLVGMIPALEDEGRVDKVSSGG